LDQRSPESLGSPTSVDTDRRADRLRGALARARRRLLALQRADGHWCAELEGDTILESEYILTMYFLGRGGTEKVGKAAAYLRSQQLPGGGWAHFPGGDAEVSTTVKAYFALKLTGDDADAEHMVRARQTAIDLGGLGACNSYTKLYLAIFGQFPWDRCPAVPPEMILLPEWMPFNVYTMSAWSRTIVVPLSMIWALRPHCQVPEAAGLRELDMDSGRRHRVSASTPREFLWATVFEAIDALLRWMERRELTPLRQAALAHCERWVLERLEKSDGLGAIFPPILNAILALRCRGYEMTHPALRGQLEALESLEIEEADTLRLQPCKSPIWDTAQALYTLLEFDLPADDPAAVSAARWLVDREVRREGDWRQRNPTCPIGGWYFEYENEFYPDCDDTAEVLSALVRVRDPNPAEARRLQEAVRRGRDWLLGMQNDNGGWAAFDRDCDMEVLTFIPFADHNAMIDPSTVDVTGRVIEALRSCGVGSAHPAIERAVGFVLREQEADGSWYGRWGANYIYGTWLALAGLEAAGLDRGHSAFERAADWLLSRQNEDGGWGESLRSYDEPEIWSGRGESTAAQTAWALLGLLAAGQEAHPAVERGLNYLLDSQRPEGAWVDDLWTGTGFPQVFYLRYHYYSTYFPLLALSRCQRAGARSMRRERVA
jgi:squalene-hopene/tetraprenyl-beta-curcumene cyclase